MTFGKIGQKQLVLHDNVSNMKLGSLCLKHIGCMQHNAAQERSKGIKLQSADGDCTNEQGRHGWEGRPPGKVEEAVQNREACGRLDDAEPHSSHALHEAWRANGHSAASPRPPLYARSHIALHLTPQTGPECLQTYTGFMQKMCRLHSADLAVMAMM